MSHWTQLGFQDSISTISEEFLYFHDFANMTLLFIIVAVLISMMKMITNKFTNKNLLQGHFLETVWTLMPGLILTQLAIPSLILLYTLEESNSNTTLTMKTVGHQWYWSYSFPEFLKDEKEFDSYMIPQNNQETSSFRLLETDNIINLPFLLNTRVLVTSGDVLHSWTVPSLGVKADATPGRLNQLYIMSHLPGVYFGQCSEICGSNHSFMPIMVQFMNFKDWSNSI